MDNDLDLPSTALITSPTLDPSLASKDRFSRILDLSLIVLGAPYILIAVAILAFLIKWDSPGPVFYRQTRIGRFGRKFHLYKFRTMVQDADQVLQHYLDNFVELQTQWSANHKLNPDPRITPLGAMLRKSSLDELPQLWNVVIGDMSWIGPRPIVDAEVEKYGKRFDLYVQVRPGITGLWQVSGRSDTTYEHRTELDEYYVRNRTLRLDLQILWKTVLVVLRGTGAY